MKKYIGIFVSILIIGFNACKKDEEFELEEAPVSSDADFSFARSANSNNILNFTAVSSNGIVVWDFGNGTTAKGITATASYPRKGTYTVSLTIFMQGGSASSKKVITIQEDDFTLLNDPLFTFLTGGVDSTNGKTWVIDSAYAGHFGVGPNPPSALGFVPEWYAATANEKSGTGLYNDEYVFNIDGFRFDMRNKGDIYVHTDHKDNFPGAFQNKGDYTAPFPEQLNESWLLQFDAGADTTITLSGSSFIGMNTNVNTYRILSIDENEMFLRYLHAGNSDLSWYLRLVRKGYDSGSGGGGGGGNPVGATLPIDFEVDPPTFESFGGSTADVIDNHDPRGINTSNKTLETVHGNETWAGVSVEMQDKFDFSTDSSIVVKIWAPTTGTLRIKLEDKTDDSINIEADVAVTSANSWIERSINFGALGAAANTYDKLVLFPGWNTTSGTFYLDDIKQE